MKNLLTRALMALAVLLCGAPAAVAQQSIAYTEYVAGKKTVKEARPDQPLPVRSTQTAVAPTVTVTASSAYASGNSVGGLLTFTNPFLSSGGSGYINRVVLNFKSAQTAQTDLVIFSANPSSTTVADKTAFSLNAADFSKVIAVVHVSDCTSLGTPSSCQAQGLAYSVRGVSTQNLYGALITRGTPTFSATSDVSVEMQVINDN